MEQQLTPDDRPEASSSGTVDKSIQVRSAASVPRRMQRIEETRSAVFAPRLEQGAIPVWVRHEAMRRPFALFWNALGLAYDGRTLYVRLIGMGKHGVGVGMTPRGFRTASKRVRFYVCQPRSGPGWHVRDRTPDRDDGVVVATVSTREAAIELMRKLQKTKPPKPPKPRKTRSTISESRPNS